jgi:hypothetical protein
MTGPTGLRRFVAGAATASAPTAPAPSAPAPGPAAAPEPPVPADGQPAAEAQSFPPAVQALLEAAVPGGQPQAESGQAEICEMCATPIPAEHSHVADLEASSLLCACRACYLLFTHSQAVRGRYRSVPDRYLSDPAHPITPAEWDELDIPVGLVFFLRSADQVTGFYPSPAGVTECRLDLAAWARLAQAHPLLAQIAPDTEAALINRRDDGGIDHFVVPIDACYELAGRMRMLWRGFDGGTEARDSMAEFLNGVRARARDLGQGA